jgi:acyl-CoA dehydrogenase
VRCRSAARDPLLCFAPRFTQKKNTMPSLAIPPCTLPPKAERLRREVRAFLAEHMTSIPARLRAENWMGFDAAFSRKMGERGWIGMTWPKKYGGHERSFLERFVVLEEVLAAGAPVGAHWIADRQSGNLLLRFGTEQMRREILPRIARGEAFFGIGMSEPDSGSDLASVRTRAERTAEGWRINGRKIWTSHAHRSHYLIGLFRTSKDEANRHAGLTQFLVDLKTPGISIRPIRDLTGDEHFNEILFENALLPADSVIGAEGNGWEQVTAELAYERSGPERYLSSIELMLQMIRAASPRNERQAVALGKLVAEARTLRHMTLGLAGMLARGENPALLASVTKDLGTTFEQRIPEIATEVFDLELGGKHGASDVPLEQLAEVASFLTQFAPSFSLRGGTREVLRGIIARGLGLR